MAVWNEEKTLCSNGGYTLFIVSIVGSSWCLLLYKGTLNLKKRFRDYTVFSKFQYVSCFRVFWCIHLMKNMLGSSTVVPGLLVAQTVKHLLRCRRPRFRPWVGSSPGGGNGNPLQYSCQENPMERRVWSATVHRVTKIWIQLSNWHFVFTPWLYRLRNSVNVKTKAYNFSKRKIRSQLESIKNSPEQAGTHFLEISLYCLTSKQLTLIDVTCSQCIFFHLYPELHAVSYSPGYPWRYKMPRHFLFP